MNQFIKLLRMNQVLKKTAADIYGAKATAQKTRGQKPQAQDKQRFKRPDVTYKGVNGQTVTKKGQRQQRFMANDQDAPELQVGANIGTPRDNGLAPGSWWGGSEPDSQVRGRMSGWASHPRTWLSGSKIFSGYSNHDQAPLAGYAANLKSEVQKQREALKTEAERQKFDDQAISLKAHNAAKRKTAQQLANKYVTERSSTNTQGAMKVSQLVTQAKRQGQAKLDGSNIIFQKTGPAGQVLQYKDNKGRTINIDKVPAGYKVIPVSKKVWDSMSKTYDKAGFWDRVNKWWNNKNNWEGTQNNLDNFFQETSRLASMNRNNYNNVV